MSTVFTDPRGFYVLVYLIAFFVYGVVTENGANEYILKQKFIIGVYSTILLQHPYFGRRFQTDNDTRKELNWKTNCY